MNCLIMCALNRLKPIRPPSSTATQISMMIIRFVMRFLTGFSGVVVVIVMSLHKLVRRRCVRFAGDAWLRQKESLRFCCGGLAGRRVVPPSAAERLEQRGRIGIARGLGLREIHDRLLILMLRIEQRDVTDAADAKLSARQIERTACRLPRIRLRAQA